MPWDDWIRTVEIEPSLYGADFSRLGEQIEALMRAECRVFHFDVGDGHFVEPITIGPIVLQSISPLVHRFGGVLDVHLMVENPAKYFPAVAEAGGDSVTFHYEAVDNVPATIRAAREQELQVGVAFNPESEPEAVAAVAWEADIVLCMSIHPGYSGQPFQEEAFDRVARLRKALPDHVHIQVDGGVGPDNARQLYENGATLLVAASAIFSREDLPRAYRRLVQALVVTLARAVELARGGRGRAYPKPTVGAVVVADGEVVAEGVTEPDGRHAEVVALEAAGERARGATLYVSLEPCNHHGTTPPCTDAILAAGIERVVVGAPDPNPEAAGGAERLRTEGVDVELVDSFDARAVNEAWRTWVAKRRPYVVYKAAVTLDGRVTMPGERWVTGEESRRAVHELRAQMDAVAVGGGTARADRPRLDARDVDTPRGQPRRLVFSRGPLPEGLDLELRSGPLADELAALAAEGVQSLLLEGGPGLAASFLEADLVDKILLFVAPTLAGAGPVAFPAALPSPRTLARLRTTQVGADVLLEAYVHHP